MADHEWLATLRQRLADQVPLTDLLREVVDDATRRIGADRGTLYLIDHARRELVSRVAHLPEISEIRLKVGEGVAGAVAESGSALRVAHGDPRIADRFDAATGYRTRSVLAVPVRCDGATVAVLQLLNKETFDAEDQRRLERIADELAAILAATSLRSQLAPGHRQPLAFRFNHIVGESPAMQEVYARVTRAAATEATVLIRGESGTGKELLARAIHFSSRRRDAPFVKVDCAALPGNLVENELFGHERGAFTGADRASDGLVAAASGGTLFLDEMGELPLPVQGKLLRLVQDRTWVRIGGTTVRTADVRFVAATHRDLARMSEEGMFRADLYWRLKVVEVVAPPLRDRGHADLDRLIDHFLFEHARTHGRPQMTLAPDARAKLHGYRWPGNVRELRHVLESAVVLAPSEEISAADLGLGDEAATAGEAFATGPAPLDEVERRYVRWMVDRCGGNRSEAARVLGIGRNTLLRKLEGR